MTHTPTPWKVRDDVVSWATWLSAGSEEYDLGEIGEGWGISDMPEAESNAARIVACVNACDGIDNAALDAGVIKSIVNSMTAIDEYLVGFGDPLAVTIKGITSHAIAKLGQTP